MVLLKKGCFCCLKPKESMLCFALLCMISACAIIFGLVHVLFVDPVHYEILFLEHFHEYRCYQVLRIFLYVLFGLCCFGVISTILALVPTCYKVQQKQTRGFVVPFIIYAVLLLCYEVAIVVWSHIVMKRATPRVEHGALYLKIVFTIWSLIVGISYYQWLGEKVKCSTWKAARIQQGPYRQLTEDIEEAPTKSKEKFAENLYFVI